MEDKTRLRRSHPMSSPKLALFGAGKARNLGSKICHESLGEKQIESKGRLCVFGRSQGHYFISNVLLIGFFRY